VDPAPTERVLHVYAEAEYVVPDPEDDLLLTLHLRVDATLEQPEQAEEHQLGHRMRAVVRDRRDVDAAVLGVGGVNAVLEVVGPERDGLQLRVLVVDPVQDVDPAADDPVRAATAFADLILNSKPTSDRPVNPRRSAAG
jgi:hypothetical protein